MAKRFRVIQGGKRDRGQTPLHFKRLFRTYSIGDLTRRGEVYHDVRFNWYCMERMEPVAPYETLIADHGKLEERHLDALKKEVDRYFTEEEVRQLGDYLKTRYGLDLEVEEVNLPVKKRSGFFAEGNKVIYDFLELSERDNYVLSFKVWGYYTIVGCLSTPELEDGVSFLRKSFQLLGLPSVWSNQDLQRVARTIYEQEGLVVRNHKEK